MDMDGHGRGLALAAGFQRWLEKTHPEEVWRSNNGARASRLQEGGPRAEEEKKSPKGSLHTVRRSRFGGGAAASVAIKVRVSSVPQPSRSF